MMPDLEHVAVIPDGNRRWARARGLTPADGHRAGIALMAPMARAAWAAGARVFTFWWGSPANLTLRSRDEVAAIVAALSDWLAEPGARLLSEHDAAFDIFGRHAELCPELAPSIDKARSAAGSGARRLVVLMAYDGRDEIREAVRAASAAGDAGRFAEHLWTRELPPVDLLIRTGDSAHLSAGFMLWSIAEARLRFVAPMWPDFTPEALTRYIAEARSSERRYGR